MNKIAKRDLNYYMGLHYTVLLREDDEGDVVATVQELPGCMAHGKDAREAWRNIREVQRAWIEDCLESGHPIPRAGGRGGSYLAANGSSAFPEPSIRNWSSEREMRE